MSDMERYAALHSKRKASSSLSKASIVFAVTALMVALVPLLGIFAFYVAVPALVLATVAVVVAVRRKQPRALASIAFVLGATAFGLAYMQVRVISTVATGFGDSVKEASQATGNSIMSALDDALRPDPEVESSTGYALHPAIQSDLEKTLSSLVGALNQIEPVNQGTAKFPELRLALPIATQELANYTKLVSPLAIGQYSGDPGRDFLVANSPPESRPDSDEPQLPMSVTVFEDGRLSICTGTPPRESCEISDASWYKDPQGRLRPVFNNADTPHIGSFEVREADQKGFTVLLTREFVNDLISSNSPGAETDLAPIPLHFTRKP